MTTYTMPTGIDIEALWALFFVRRSEAAKLKG